MARLLAGHFFCICLKCQNLQTMKHSNIFAVVNRETKNTFPNVYGTKELAEKVAKALNKEFVYPFWEVQIFVLTTPTKFVLVDFDNE